MTSNLAHMPQRYVPQWTFAERIRKVRRDFKMTQEDFAESILGLRVSTYSAWETGRNTPDLAQLAPVLEWKTGVPKEWFLGWADESPRPAGPDGGNVHPLGLEPRTHWIRDYHNITRVDFGGASREAA